MSGVNRPRRRDRSQIPADALAILKRGAVIPAHPLALDAQRKLDARRQRALTRYYIDAGSGGLAVGVHTTQFAIRDVGLYEPVLRLALETADEWTNRPLVKIAGLAGRTEQAVAEARLAASLGYHAGLLSLAAFKGTSEDEMVAHCEAVAREIPVVGFYLQTAVGGVPLPVSFWRRFAAIDNVVAIKMAPFNRYRTLDVIRGVIEAKAEDRITLYTGNDDHIVLDLLCPFDVRRGSETVRVRVRGGLLGHWSVWTKAAVDLMERLHRAVDADDIDLDLLALDSRVTDCNAAVFDVANDFHGVIAGCHEVLRRQGLLEGIWCLDPKESPRARTGRGADARGAGASRPDRRCVRPRQPGKVALMTLSGAQIDGYARLGHLTVPGVFTRIGNGCGDRRCPALGRRSACRARRRRAQMVSRCRRCQAGAAQARQPRLPSAGVPQPGDKSAAGEPRRIDHRAEGVTVYFSQIFFKPPEGGGPKPVHQDNFYFGPRDRDEMVTAWVALDDATVENGCLYFGEGSNRGPVIPHVFPPGEPFNLLIPDEVAKTSDDDARASAERRRVLPSRQYLSPVRAQSLNALAPRRGFPLW